MDGEVFKAHIEAAQTTLTASVAKGAEFSPMVMVIRDDRMVAQIMPGAGDGGNVAKVARVAAASFGADELLMVSDTYMASGQDTLNPITGKDWRPGEMEDVVNHHRGLEQGFVVEALLVFHTGYGVANHMVSLPYKRHGKRVEWLPPDDMEDGYKDQRVNGGRFANVFDGLTRDMRVPDPIAALLLGRMDAMVALAFFEDETDPMMLQLKEDIESGKLRTM